MKAEKPILAPKKTLKETFQLGNCWDWNVHCSVDRLIWRYKQLISCNLFSLVWVTTGARAASRTCLKVQLKISAAAQPVLVLVVEGHLYLIQVSICRVAWSRPSSGQQDQTFQTEIWFGASLKIDRINWWTVFQNRSLVFMMACLVVGKTPSTECQHIKSTSGGGITNQPWKFHRMSANKVNLRRGHHQPPGGPIVFFFFKPIFGFVHLHLCPVCSILILFFNPS